LIRVSESVRRPNPQIPSSTPYKIIRVRLILRSRMSRVHCPLGSSLSNHLIFEVLCLRSTRRALAFHLWSMGSGWALFALRAALSLFLSSHSDVSNLCIPGKFINGENANRPLPRREAHAPRSRGLRNLPSKYSRIASPSMRSIRYLILLHRQHTSNLVAKVACRSLRLFGSYCYTDQGTFPSEHAARKVIHDDPQLRKELG